VRVHVRERERVRVRESESQRVRVRVRARARARVCVCVCVCVCEYMHICIHMYGGMYVINLFTYACLYIHIAIISIPDNGGTEKSLKPHMIGQEVFIKTDSNSSSSYTDHSGSSQKMDVASVTECNNTCVTPYEVVHKH
jgi:hypothetical protein